MRHLTEKMRKRDMAANAVLATGLIGNLQSPQHFVRSGHIEAPGVQLMQRMMKKRKEADRNLDSGVVSQGARNRSNVSAPSTKKRMATAYDRMKNREKKQKREKADEIIRDLRKEQKTFQDFMLECYELEESSTGDERGRRRLSPRGPSGNRSDRNKQRQDKSNRAALSKAGFSRSPKLPTGKGGRRTKWTETSASTHHDTETGTYANQSDYAVREIGNLGPKGNIPTKKRALKAKQIRKQFGGDRTSRPVHDVAVNKKRTYNDDSSTMTKGRSFRNEVTKGVEKNLEKAGAKPGDIRTSTPTSDSRSRMYGRTHGLKTSKRTGITVDRIREWIDILEVKRPESGSDIEKARWDRQKERQDTLENPSSKIIGQTGRDKEGNRKYGLKDAELRKQQGKNRAARLADVDSDLDPKQKGRGY